MYRLFIAYSLAFKKIQDIIKNICYIPESESITEGQSATVINENVEILPFDMKVNIMPGTAFAVMGKLCKKRFRVMERMNGRKESFPQVKKWFYHGEYNIGIRIGDLVGKYHIVFILYQVEAKVFFLLGGIEKRRRHKRELR